MKQTALITGASRGIGAALAETFARAGYQLTLCCQHSEEKLMTLSKRLQEQYHTTVLVRIGDVGDYAFVKTMVDATLEAFGAIDVLINNAGISYTGNILECLIRVV